MSVENGGEQQERLAPVIPLFGRSGSRRDGPPSVMAPDAETEDDRAPGPDHPAHRARLRALGRHARPVGAPDPRPPRQHHLLQEDQTFPQSPSPQQDVRELLVRRLRAKQLSSAEARDVLRGQGVPREQIDEVIDEFEERGYLNDQALAEYLVTAGSERKGQGRVAIGRTLAQRGVPRDIADAALASLEDDDAERALDFARTKAPSLVRFDDDTALRRLVGQLARRGYAGSVAMGAARTAMREARRGGGGLGGLTGGAPDARSRVRFEDTDDTDGS